MKTGIHPKWYPNCKATCACGNAFTVGATVPEIQVEVCSSCHPFFTGQMKFVDTKGRVQKFQDRMKKAAVLKTKKKKKSEKTKKERPESFKEMIRKMDINR